MYIYMTINVIQKLGVFKACVCQAPFAELWKDRHADFSIMSWELQLKCLFYE